MNIKRLRSFFPALSDGKKIYFDNAATSLTPKPVIDEVVSYYEKFGVNAGRGAYKLAFELSMKLEEARENVASFINASPEEIVFTFNTTDSINKLALSLDLKPEDRVLITQIEHHSNLLPWKLLEKNKEVKVDVLPVNEEGGIDIDLLDKYLKNKSKMFAFTAASNVLGTILKAKEMSDLAHTNGALVLIDAAQIVGHRKFDAREVGCDFAAFSAHKMCGPPGVGVLYIKKGAEKHLSPAFLGGGTVKEISGNQFFLREHPYDFEPGTLNIPGILGFNQAVKFVENIGLDNIERKIQNLYRFIINELSSNKNILLYNNTLEENVGIVSFNIKGVSPHQAAVAYDNLGNIMLRSGFHCAIPFVQAIGAKEGTIRASVAFYNTIEEAERFIEITSEVISAIK